MLPNRAATAFCALLLCALALPSAADAALVTSFNFNSYDPDVHGNDFTNTQVGGSGQESRIRLLESDGTSGWNSGDLDAGNGTTENRVGTTDAGKALSLENPTAHNGGILELEFDTLGYNNIELSFAIRSPAFEEFAIQYSTDGVNWSTASSGNIIESSYEVVIENIGNASTAYTRLVFTGPTNTTFALVDNLQINGTSVPEAPAVAMMVTALVLFGGVAYRRRRTAAGQTVHAQVLAA